ncbi:cohesin domain-containing protein [Natronobacterium texcoconense]|uniref:Uncharacterized protein n=1 Tax=Natronobacterium texcoconense TaxID=1095778 RepID=A0A1H1HQK8_NATTX|nr:cohesin domain-containing protein [Natronobacterium texcoconense]SDR27649.1 hypothetical protein SAMN04489842_2957 [Natronobacterium texcoconense]
MTTKSNRTRLLVIAAIIGLAVATMAVGVQAAGELPTTTDDETVTLELLDEDDETVTLAVTSNKADVAGFQANVSYASDDTTVKHFEFGDIGGWSNNNTNQDGYVYLTESTTGDNSVDEPTLATITFAVDGDADFDLVEDDTSVSDGDGQPITGSDDGDDGGGGAAPGGGGVGGASGDDSSSDDGEDGTDDSDENDDSEASDDEDESDDDSSDTDSDDETETQTEETTTSEESDSDDDGIPGFTVVGAVVAGVIGLLCLVTVRRHR